MTDEEIRERILALWKRICPEALLVHCGGKGLVVGCPVCGKRWK